MSSETRIEVMHLPTDFIEDAIYVIQQSNPNDFTHNYFKYPCKFIPEIPRWAIKNFLHDKNVDSLILDPFSGSGTTLLEASLNGVNSLGCEIDDLAKLVTKVKTTNLTDVEKNNVLDFLEGIDETVLKVKKEYRLPSIKNLDHWYREDVSKLLAKILYSIEHIDNENEKNFLLVCFASILKKVSNADDVSPKPYVSKKIIKVIPDVLKIFKLTTQKFLREMESFGDVKLASVEITGNALNIASEENTVSLAITSPPYINAFDYVRTLRLENLWLNLSTEELLLEKKKRYVGTESIVVKDEEQDIRILDESAILKRCYYDISTIDKKRALIVKRFFENMKTNLKEVYRVLKPGCHYIVVIGNSNIRQVEVESWKILSEIAAGIGYSNANHFAYEIKNPYIRIPRSGNGGKIALDHILILRK